MPVSTIEERVANLEQEVARPKSRAGSSTSDTPWWEKIRGTFKDDPIYDEAMRPGRAWRESQPLANVDEE